MRTISKKEIKSWLPGVSVNWYWIETIERGKHYVVTFYSYSHSITSYLRSKANVTPAGGLRANKFNVKPYAV